MLSGPGGSDPLPLKKVENVKSKPGLDDQGLGVFRTSSGQAGGGVGGENQDGTKQAHRTIGQLSQHLREAIRPSALLYQLEHTGASHGCGDLWVSHVVVAQREYPAAF